MSVLNYLKNSKVPPAVVNQLSAEHDRLLAAGPASIHAFCDQYHLSDRVRTELAGGGKRPRENANFELPLDQLPWGGLQSPRAGGSPPEGFELNLEEEWDQVWGDIQRDESAQAWAETQRRAEADLRDESAQAWAETQRRAEADLDLWATERDESDQAWEEMQRRAEADLASEPPRQRWTDEEYDEWLREREQDIQVWAETQLRAMQDRKDVPQVAVMFGTKKDQRNILYIPITSTIKEAYESATEFARERGWLKKEDPPFALSLLKNFTPGSNLLLLHNNNLIKKSSQNTLAQLFARSRSQHKVLIPEIRFQPRERICKYKILPRTNAHPKMYPRLVKRLKNSLTTLCWKSINLGYAIEKLESCFGIVVAETTDLLSRRTKTCGVLIFRIEHGTAMVDLLCSDMYVGGQLLKKLEVYAIDKGLHTVWLDAVPDQFVWYMLKGYTWTGKQSDTFEMIKILDVNANAIGVVHYNLVPNTLPEKVAKKVLTDEVNKFAGRHYPLPDFLTLIDFVMNSTALDKYDNNPQTVYKAKTSTVDKLIKDYPKFGKRVGKYLLNPNLMTDPKFQGFRRYINA